MQATLEALDGANAELQEEVHTCLMSDHPKVRFRLRSRFRLR
tara:strand:- start:97 stop:222 length:126 start_codon:yes stop_codon:yes gene_type:complete